MAARVLPVRARGVRNDIEIGEASTIDSARHRANTTPESTSSLA